MAVRTRSSGFRSYGKELSSIMTSIELVKRDLSEIKEEVVGVKDGLKTTASGLDMKMEMLDNKYVTQAEFRWIRTFVYGEIGLILAAVGGAIMNVILKG